MASGRYAQILLWREGEELFVTIRKSMNETWLTWSVNAAASRWPRSWIWRFTSRSSATTPVRPNDPAARAIFLPASTWARCSATCSRTGRRNGRAARRRSPARIRGLVEAGAGNGRLSADILRAANAATRLLSNASGSIWSEASAAARAQHPAGWTTLTGDSSYSSAAGLPDSFEGVLVANELLDAFPVHQVVMRRRRPARSLCRWLDGAARLPVTTRKDRCRRQRWRNTSSAWTSHSSPDGASRSNCGRWTGSAKRRGVCGAGSSS